MKNILKKFKIPRFFKTKKFFILAVAFIVVFLFAPISLRQISNKAENLINDRAKEGVKAFERQTGLEIKWRLLKFNIFLMSAELRDVQVTPPRASYFQKIQELKFLDGRQTFKKISARPSLYSLLFEKRIVLAKLTVKGGDIYLKTLKPSLAKTKTPPGAALPIKQFLIKDTNISLSHQGHIYQLARLHSRVFHKPGERFDFNFFVKAFSIYENPASQGFQSFSSRSFQPGAAAGESSAIYQLAFKGSAKKGKVSFQEIRLGNKSFQSLTEWLDIHFDSKGLREMSLRSSGSLPLFLIHRGMSLMSARSLISGDFLSYKLNIQYKKNKGYQGFFETQGQDIAFRSQQLKSFSLKGRLAGWLLSLDKGSIETQSQGSAKLSRGKWNFKKAPLSFEIFADTNKLSFDFINPAVLNTPGSPLKGDLTARIHCQGAWQTGDLKCSMKGHSAKLSFQLEDSGEIISLHKMNLSSDIEWSGQTLNFTVSGEKNEAGHIHINGKYEGAADRWEADYSFRGALFADLRIHTPFLTQGNGEIQNGKLAIETGQTRLSGAFSFPLLKLSSFQLENISGLYQMAGSQLQFLNIKGSPGSTSYTAKCHIDFNRESLSLQLKSPFLNIEDFSRAVQESAGWPFSLKGTGSVSFSMDFPWSSPENKAFQFTGDFFNVLIGQDAFQQATLDFGLQNKKGAVRNVLLKKDQGAIQGKGSFDTHFNLNLEAAGRKLSLERLARLNEILPFNQSGDVHFSMKVIGQPHRPKISGDILISNMFLYSYPVQNSKIQVKMDDKALSFSGRIMDKITIDKFIYPFSGPTAVQIAGQFDNLDFVEALLAKFRMEKTRDYSSQISGSFSLFKDGREHWAGQADIDKLFISKSNKWIKNDKPFSITVRESKWSLTPAIFSHQNGKTLKITERKNGRLLLSGESSLSLFSAFFPYIQRMDGNIKGQVLMESDFRRMRPKGSLQIEEGSLAISPLPELAQASASLVFLKDDIFINNFAGEASGGQVKGGGSLFYDFIHSPRLSLSLDFFDVHFNIPEGFNTRGDGKIQIQGKSPPYLISGHYLIDSGSITQDFLSGESRSLRDFSFLEEEAQKEPAGFNLKLNIKTQRAVALNSSLLRSSIEGQADIYGPLSSLLIDGRFALSQTAEENLIFFRGQEFKISSGSILFRHSPPDNPYLNVKAQTVFKESITDPLESQQEIEREYKILLSLQGLSQNPRFSLRSSPPLNEKEIISLLTLGVGSRHFDANVAEHVTGYSYQLLGSLLVESSLNREIKNLLGLDFRLTPYINTSNKPITKVTLSRSWLDKWRASFSRTIEEDALSDVRLKYDLSKKISLTAFWEDIEQKDNPEQEEERMGLDVEFNLDF